MKKILMFSQNSTHIENMQYIEKKLIDFNITYLQTNYIYKQNLIYNNLMSVDEGLKLFNLTESFYLLSFYEKLKTINLLKSKVKEIMNNYDAFICGNDGAIQRIFIYYAKQQNKKTFILLDGMISDYELRLIDILKYSDEQVKDMKQLFQSKVKTIIYNIFRNSRLNFYLPSNVGCSKVDGIFLIGEHSQKILERQSNLRCFYSTGLPRYEFLDTYRNRETDKQILYLTGAFKWHNYYAYDKYQHADIELLIESIIKLNLSEYKLIIKIHPRDEIKNYNKYNSYTFVEIVVLKDIFDLIAESELIISHISTTLVESLVMNKKAISLMINFPYWKFKNSFISSNSIKKVFDKKELEGELLELKKTGISKELFYDDLFSKNTFQSSFSIANIIKDKLD